MLIFLLIMKKSVFLLSLLLIISSLTVFAHDHDLVEKFTTTSVYAVLAVSVLVIVLIIASMLHEKRKKDSFKWGIFLGIAIPVVLVTLYVAGSTIYLNVVSDTKGPVHWHADFEIWHCGNKIDLLDPTGLSNRIGNPVLHEHGDDRIHVEGVVVKYPDVNLGKFFEIIGGTLQRGSLTIPTNQGILNMKDGDKCGDIPGKLQVFILQVQNPEDHKNWNYKQIKMVSYDTYILRPQSQVPPGDCIIIEFGDDRSYTDKKCETFKVTEQRGELSGS